MTDHCVIDLTSQPARRSSLLHRRDEIYWTKKEAWDRAEELNNKSTSNHYWVEPAPFIQSTSESD